MTVQSAIDLRALVVAPTGGDARNTVSVLEKAGFRAEAFDNLAVAAEKIGQGCGTLIIAEEALPTPHFPVLQSALAAQPKWSNIPVVLITSGGREKRPHHNRLGFAPNALITLLERPLRAATLIAAVEAAIGSRVQQYEIRDLIAEREKLLASLEQRVLDRTARLQAMVEEMEAFSYSVSHDLRAPLRVLSGYAEVVREDYSKDLPPEGHRLLEKIAGAASRMDRLTQDLLAYTRIANGEVALGPIDLDELVEGVIESYPTLLEVKKHIRVRRPLGKCLGHAPSLVQCISNLLDNAVKFSKPGEPIKIEVSTVRRKDRIRLSISDRGVGIDPQYHERIFGIFERVNDKARGTGIGLAIVKKAAQRMNGTVGVKSGRGHGTEFWVELDAME